MYFQLISTFLKYKLKYIFFKNVFSCLFTILKKAIERTGLEIYFRASSNKIKMSEQLFLYINIALVLFFSLIFWLGRRSFINRNNSRFEYKADLPKSPLKSSVPQQLAEEKFRDSKNL